MTKDRERYDSGALGERVRDSAGTSRLSDAAFEREFIAFEESRGNGNMANRYLKAFRNATSRARLWGGSLYDNMTSTDPNTALAALDEFQNRPQYQEFSEGTQIYFYSALRELEDFWRAKIAAAKTYDYEIATVDWDDVGNLELDNTTPVRVVFRGATLKGIDSWRALYVRVVEELITQRALTRNSVKSKKTGAALLGGIGNAKKMTDPIPVGETGFFLETLESDNETLKVVNGFRKLSGVEKDELQIKYRRAVPKAPEAAPARAARATEARRRPTYLVDFNNIPDLTDATPVRLVVFGREVGGCSSWRSLHLRLAECLMALGKFKPYIGLCLRSSTVLDFGDSDYLNRMTAPAPIGNTGFYMSTKSDGSKTLRYVKYLLDYCGILYSKIRIEYEYLDREIISPPKLDVERIVNALDSSLSNRKIVEKFCEEKGVFTIDELEILFSKIPVIAPIILEWVAAKTTRLSYDKFILRGNVKFDVPETDAFLAIFCYGHEYVPLKRIVDANVWKSFPKATTVWNEFLLESYLDGVSKKFKLWNIGRRKKGVGGAMVRKPTTLRSYDELLADAFARTELELNQENALDYFCEEKLLLRRFYKSIENVVEKAKKIRGEIRKETLEE